ncbi:MAG: hypothetical protein U1F81_17840 [Verrucomicrobiaceae bacterium]
MTEPSFDPERAERMHHSIFFSGLTDRLSSRLGAITEYENLHLALSVIDAPKSREVVAEFLDMFKLVSNQDFSRIDEEIAAHESEVEELSNRYLTSNEDVVGLIHQFCERLAD